MKTLLIANIGNSDLGKNDEPIFVLRKDNVYEKSKEIFKKGGSQEYEAILLEPQINKIIIENYQINKIYLFATEQEPMHPTDSIYVARIVKEILKDKFGFEDKQVELLRIDENPADFDAMFKAYEVKVKSIEDGESIFVSLTGGTTQMNLSLLFHSLLRFGDRVSTIYKPRGKKKAEIIGIGPQIRNVLLLEQVKALKEMHLYTAAAALAEKCKLPKDEVNLLKAFGHRISFNFDAVKHLIKELNPNYEPRIFSKKEIDNFLGDVGDLLKLERATNKMRKKLENFQKLENLQLDKEYFEIHKLLIRELYESMMKKWEQKEYADFVTRLHRFEEAVLRFLLQYFAVKENLTNWQHYAGESVKQGDPQKNFCDLIIKNLNSEECRREEAKNWLILQALHCLKNGIGLDKEIYEVLSTINNFMSKIRNRLMNVHGWEGVSREKLMRAFSKAKNLSNNESEIEKIFLEDIKKISDFVMGCPLKNTLED